MRVQAAVPKPAQRIKYKNMAIGRLRLKKNYLEDKSRGETNTIGHFLSNMGHNVANAVMSGRIDNYEESRSKDAGEADDNDVSNWVPELENSVLEELECSDPYSHRKIGEKEVLWKNKKCPSCKVGFNAKSRPY